MGAFIALLCLGQAQRFDITKFVAEVAHCPIRIYGAKDEKGAGLDCLKIVQVGPSDYLGIYHAKNKGVFEVHLARSSDLTTWKRVQTLDIHAHQGTLYGFGKRWIAAWEKDGPKGNWIHVRAYNSLKDLLAGINMRQKDIPRTLSAGAEGTPSVESARASADWQTSTITLRFHYYRDMDVDRQAEGTLTDFRGWAAGPNEADNHALDNVIQGNLGDRDSFTLGGVTYDLLEGQLYKNDWSSWRIILRDRSQGASFRALDIRTDGGSTSFANPTATVITLPDGKPGMVFTCFIPSQGAAPGEGGELIYARALPKVLK